MENTTKPWKTYAEVLVNKGGLSVADADRFAEEIFIAGFCYLKTELTDTMGKLRRTFR